MVRCETDGTGCVNIAGATGPTYILVAADARKKLKVCEDATNSQGTASACSDLTDVIAQPGASDRIDNGGFERHSGAHDNNNGTDAAWDSWIVSQTLARFVESTTSGGSNEQFAGNAALKIRNYNGQLGSVRQDFVPSAWKRPAMGHSNLPTIQLARQTMP
jgi:hypothetical protein